MLETGWKSSHLLAPSPTSQQKSVWNRRELGMGLHCEWGARATSRAGKRTQNTPLPNVHSAHLHGSKKTKLPCCCLHGTTFYFNGFLLFSHTTTLLLWTVSWRQVFRSWETSKFDSWTISFEMFMSELEWDRGKGVCVCGGCMLKSKQRASLAWDFSRSLLCFLLETSRVRRDISWRTCHGFFDYTDWAVIHKATTDKCLCSKARPMQSWAGLLCKLLLAEKGMFIEIKIQFVSLDSC